MSFTDATELDLLNKEFSATNYTPPATLYAALFTVVGSDDGSGFTEASGGAYARVAVTNNATNFPSANPKLNAAAVTFPTATSGGYASGARIRGLGLYDASSGGNLRAYGYLCSGAVLAVGLATGDIVWAPGHAFTNDMAVIVWAASGMTLPTGISKNTTYYAKGVSGDSFQLAATAGGAAIDLTGNGTFYIARDRSIIVQETDIPSVGIGDMAAVLD